MQETRKICCHCVDICWVGKLQKYQDKLIKARKVLPVVLVYHLQLLSSPNFPTEGL